ncbi:MAG TPA: hypothetical protein PKK10_10615 [Woeseiaceae bacterium]|nr:hypothetical protein [Woeseiaceae bacterium]
MRAIGQLLLVCALALLVLATADARADAIKLDTDGWQSWETRAGTNGQRACCFFWNGGGPVNAVCELDANQSYAISDDCALIQSDQLRVYVLMQSGNVRDIRAFSAGCRVASKFPINDIGKIDERDSIAWLSAQVQDDSDFASDAMHAIVMHSDPAAFEALTRVLENRSQNVKNREEALFWLAQLDSDEAFDYLDRLLSKR